MELQHWIYLVFAVIWIVAKAMKKKEEEPAADRRQPNQNPSRRVETARPQAERPKPLTFEELLKEITEAKQAPIPAPAKPVQQTPPPRVQPTSFVDYDDDLKDEEQDLETIPSDYKRREKSYNEYEEAKRQAFARPSLEETMNVRDTLMTFGKFKVFEQDKERDLLTEYTRDLWNTEGLKKAFVLTEILNRKF